MSNAAPAAFTIVEFAKAARVSRSTLYGLPPELQPKSVKVRRRRVIVEQPTAWLERYGASTSPAT